MAADQPINHPQVYPFSCGNWPASDGGRSADQSSAGVPALLWELACQRRRPDSRPIIRRCTRCPVGAGLSAKAADQPVNHPQVYPFSCGNWPASDGGRSADQSSAGVPVLLWELACQRWRPISRSIIRRCTRSPVGTGLPAMAADQPINHPQVYPLSCGSWLASEGDRSADQSSAGVPVLLWELACQRWRPISRSIIRRCTRCPVGAGSSGRRIAAKAA